VILNAYAVLDAFVALLQLLVGLLAAGLALAAWKRRRAGAPEDATGLEDRNYLVSLLALLLLGLNLTSWPLLYLLLQSYVPEWPGVMCIYGVTRVGAGSVGAAGFLPGLITALQALKPALVFVSGAWFVLYLVNRGTRTGPLLGRLFAVLAVAGTLAAVSAGVELTYLSIPKKEQKLSAGCCTGDLEEPAGAWAEVADVVERPGARPWLYAAYYATNLALLGTLFGLTRRARPVRSAAALVPLLAGALLTFAAAAVFLTEVVAPALLRLPFHHCPYDLVPGAPDALVGVVLFVGGTFAVGWACVAGWFARCPETRPFLGSVVERALFLALCCYLGSLVMTSVELALA
jgi:hypothetical protein